MPPLRGLDLRGRVFLQRYHPYGIQERFEGSKVSDQSPVRLGMHVAFGRVRRKTEPTGPGAEAVIFSKIDTYGVLLATLPVASNAAPQVSATVTHFV